MYHIINLISKTKREREFTNKESNRGYDSTTKEILIFHRGNIASGLQVFGCGNRKRQNRWVGKARRGKGEGGRGEVEGFKPIASEPGG